MKKNKKIKNIPNYAWGASDIQKAQGIASTGLDLLQNAVSGQPVNAGTVLGSTAKGAATGAMFGHVGAIVGGAAGALAGSIGTVGSVDENTGEYVDPSGIAGMFGHSKDYIRNKAGRIRNGLASRQRSEDYAAEYYSQVNPQYMMMANGGIATNTNAYLDDGELIRTPDGTIGSIPEEGKPQDSNLVNVPIGTQVLSDKLKVPGTNKTFAEMGKKLMKKSNKIATDKYAENSKMLNERNNQLEYNRLLQLQESIKNKKRKGIKGSFDQTGYADGTPYLDDDFRNTSIEQIQQGWYVPSNSGSSLKPNMFTNLAIERQPVQSTQVKGIGRKQPASTTEPTDYSSLMDYASALTAPLANMFTPRSQKVDTFTYTPKYGPTYYDINDQLDQVDLTDSMARYNQAQINPNTGAGMAFGLQSAVNRNKQIASLYDVKRNAENQMISRNADIYNQWANQYANARHTAATEQAQNDAVTRNIRRKGLGDLSTRLQQISKDRKMTSRDQAIMEAMIPYLEYGMTSEQLKKLVNGLKS